MLEMQKKLLNIAYTIKHHSKNSAPVSKDIGPVQVLQIFVARRGDDDEVCNHRDTRIMMRLDITSYVSHYLPHTTLTQRRTTCLERGQ